MIENDYSPGEQLRRHGATVDGPLKGKLFSSLDDFRSIDCASSTTSTEEYKGWNEGE